MQSYEEAVGVFCPQILQKTPQFQQALAKPVVIKQKSLPWVIVQWLILVLIALGYGFSHCWLILQWYTLNQGWNTSCPVSVNRSNFILSKWMKLQSLLVLDPVFYVLLNYWGAVGWKGRAQGNKGDDHKGGPCGHDSREIFAWPWNSEQRLNPSTSPLPSESLNLSTSQGF